MTDDPLSNDEACRRRADRDRLIACLAPFGIASVIITFDGYGDDGQIEDVAAYNAANERIDLPGIMVGFVDPVPLAEALENFAYDTLAELQCGWQDNDGSYGTVTLDVASGKAILDFNARFTDAHNSVIEL